MSDHGQNKSPEEMFEPDTASATALFFILGFMAVGLVVCIIVIWQWFSTASRAEKSEKGKRPNPELISLEDGQLAELAEWTQGDCLQELEPAGATETGKDEGDAGEKSDGDKDKAESAEPPCTPAERSYSAPIEETIVEVASWNEAPEASAPKKDFLAPGPAPKTPSDGANQQNPEPGTRGAPKDRRREMRKVPNQPNRIKIDPNRGGRRLPKDIKVQPRRAQPHGNVDTTKTP